METSTERATVYVVDDDPSTSRLLSAAGHAVETFETPRALVAAAPSMCAGCVVADLILPGMTGLELLRALPEMGCALPLVFVTGHGNVAICAEAMKRGAVDFLEKPVDAARLLAAVETAFARDAKARAAHAARQDFMARMASLTPREREVCEGAARGLLNKQIGAELGIASPTVQIHRTRGMAKLGVGSAAELAVLWERLGAGG